MALITPIQSTGAHSTASVASLAKAFTSNVTAGSTLVVMAGVWFTGDVSTTITDTQGLTWTEHVPAVKMRVWTAVAASSGPCTVTVSVVSSTNYMAIGLAELPAGSYSFSRTSNLGSGSGTTQTSQSVSVTIDGAALFGLMTCQGNPLGTITEDAAWSLIIESTNFSFLPYSFIWRNADIGTYQAQWTVGASGITCYMGVLVVEGVPDAALTKGSLVVGADGDLTSSHTALFNLDGVDRTEAGAISAKGSVVIGGNLMLIEQGTAPSAIANAGRIWVEDNGSGKSRLMVRFGTGASVQIAIEP